ncbi:hypothetical protein F66182_8610 [Fusarium sp. NRRL 66182]|nr:hypothetical protein F66182_8610 [Fusarium sp. NRRL 66182]
MSALTKLREGLARQDNTPVAHTLAPHEKEITEAPGIVEAGPDHDKEATAGAAAPNDKGNESDVPSEDVQAGVKEIQAITLTWGKGSLAALLCLIWLLFLLSGFRLSFAVVLMPYLTSEWQAHSLMTTIPIVADAMTAAVYIPMAKALDVWGRAEGFLLMSAFATLGLALMAASQNLATFCAAQVFYSVGWGGMIYAVGVLAADASNLRNRGLAFAFTSSPYMITAFAGSRAAASFVLDVQNWRWGFGWIALVLPFVSIPLFLVLKVNLRKAFKNGTVAKTKRTRGFIGSIWWAFNEFDVVGIFLFGGGLVVFLLPFNLAAHAPSGWSTDYIIAMLVVGLLVLVFFGVWEYWLAPVPFLQGRFLIDRSVIAACMIDFTYQVSYYTWNYFFSSFLQVVVNLGPAEAGYVNSTFQVVSGVLLFIVGYLIRRTGYYKWTFYFAVPIYIFALGLMIHFRAPNQYVGYIIMCEIFISVGGAVFILVMQLAVLAAVAHQYVAAALATLYVAGGVGGAVGGAISGAIWTNTFIPALARNLPEEELPNLALIAGNFVNQLAYPVNSPTRLAIQESYGYAQVRMLAAGVGVASLFFVWVPMLRNINVKKLSQTKGTVL